MDILTEMLRRTLVGAKAAPTVISRTFIPSTRRIRFPQQGLFFLGQVHKLKSADEGGLGGLGVK